MNHIPTINKLKKYWGVYQQSSGTDITEDKNSIVYILEELLGPEHKMLVGRKSKLYHKISNIYRIVWGQFTLALKEDIIGLDEYGVNSN